MLQTTARTLLCAAVSALAIGAAGAQAASLSLDTSGLGGSFAVGSSNDYLDEPGGYLASGDTLSFGQLVLSGNANVTFTYIGNEAGYTNTLWINGSAEESTSGDPDNVWNEVMVGTFAMSGGLLDFGFCTSNGYSLAGYGRCVQNDDTGSVQDQFAGYLGDNRSIAFKALGDGSYLALWDDSGAQNDDNHDDMIVRIQVEQVPVPGTLGLLGLGLLGVGALRRRAA